MRRGGEVGLGGAQIRPLWDEERHTFMADIPEVLGSGIAESIQIVGALGSCAAANMGGHLSQGLGVPGSEKCSKNAL